MKPDWLNMQCIQKTSVGIHIYINNKNYGIYMYMRANCVIFSIFFYISLKKLTKKIVNINILYILSYLEHPV